MRAVVVVVLVGALALAGATGGKDQECTAGKGPRLLNDRPSIFGEFDRIMRELSDFHTEWQAFFNDPLFDIPMMQPWWRHPLRLTAAGGDKEVGKHTAGKPHTESSQTSPAHAELPDGCDNEWRAPAVHVDRAEDVLRVTVDMPGLTKENVKVKAEGHTLTIEGTRREQSEGEKGWTRLCRAYKRILRMPNDVKSEHIKANFDHGVLTVLLPREKREHGTKEITVE